jgi:hypothetical protein
MRCLDWKNKPLARAQRVSTERCSEILDQLVERSC